MSTIRIQRAHQQTVSAMRRTAEDIARRIESRHDVRWRWLGDSMELVAPKGLHDGDARASECLRPSLAPLPKPLAGGTHGRVTIDDAEVRIEIHLPLALTPVRAAVARQVAAKLDVILGA
jgi:hypothetical protein